jgi:hypothetical protein
MQTVIKYQDTALPLAATDVTLFNSSVAFPPGGSFHLLNQQWFQWSILFTSAGAGVVEGSFSEDKGVTWTQFYTSDSIASTVPSEDEVYVGMYKDVLFELNMDANTTVFSARLALNDCKPTSKVTAADLLVDG